MKTKSFAPILFALGFSVCAEPSFAMKSNLAYNSADPTLALIAMMLFTASELFTANPGVIELESEIDSPVTTFVAQSGTHFEVPANVLGSLRQLAPTIDNLLTSLEDTDVSTFPLIVSDPGFYLLVQMANNAKKTNLLAFVRNLSDSEIKKLKDDAEFLNSTALKTLISQAVDNLFALFPNENLVETFERVDPQNRSTSIIDISGYLPKQT